MARTSSPCDYKGGNVRGVVLSEILREGAARLVDYDPTGLGQEAVENDMEGVQDMSVQVRQRNHESTAQARAVDRFDVWRVAAELDDRSCRECPA